MDSSKEQTEITITGLPLLRNEVIPMGIIKEILQGITVFVGIIVANVLGCLYPIIMLVISIIIASVVMSYFGC